MLHKVCNLYGHTAEDRQDLFQEIITQLWRSYPRFRSEAKFSTWLYRIALNTAISDLRKKKKRGRAARISDPSGFSHQQETEEEQEQRQLLYLAIGQLTEVERALVMLYLEDRSYEEMEEILGINQNNLRVKMNRIKEKLRKITKQGIYGT